MIRFEHVTKTYRLHRGEKTILRDCVADFPAGSRVGVLGMNGAGKSTLLRLIAWSESPNAGRILRRGWCRFPWASPALSIPCIRPVRTSGFWRGSMA